MNKRELRQQAAMAAMHGMLSNPNAQAKMEKLMAEYSVRYANALIDELEAYEAAEAESYK